MDEITLAKLSLAGIELALQVLIPLSELRFVEIIIKSKVKIVTMVTILMVRDEKLIEVEN